MTGDPTWTAEDSQAAHAEGWDIFWVDGDDDKPEIQVDSSNPLDWANDSQVIRFVEHMALAGSELHMKALVLERSWHDPYWLTTAWNAQPSYSHEEWRSAVADGATQIGYADWVKNKILNE